MEQSYISMPDEGSMIASPNDQLIASPHRLNPMAEYNYVVRCYNHDSNRVGSIHLEEMLENAFYTSMYMRLQRKVYMVMLYIFMLILPGINLIIYTLLVVMYFKYLEAWKVYLSNFKIQPNPFQHMVFAPELCQMFNKNNWFFDISMQQLQGFTLNLDIVNQLKVRQLNGNIKFMVYNSAFLNYFKDFPRLRSAHLCMIFTSTILILLSGVIIYVIIFASTNLD